MNDYVIVTDSTSDLYENLYEKMDVKVVPMDFFVDENPFTHYHDYREMSLTNFYKNVRDGKKITTTQINPCVYESVFSEILGSGKDVIYLCFSSGLSGTYQRSKLSVESLSKKFPGRRIQSIDTLCASIGEGLLVWNASEQKKNGKNFDQLVDWIEKNKRNIEHWFVVDDLEHLKQGGRISSVQASIGTLFNLKPIITLDSEGKLVPVSKQRGMKKALEEFLRRLQEHRDILKNQTIIIGHTDNPSGAKALYDQIKNLDIVKDIVISEIGPVIGAHVGAGMVALTFMKSQI